MARCRVCHRTMTNPAHIAAGVGPVCAQRAAAFGVGTGAAERAAYPAEKLARIDRNIVRCARAIERAQEYQRAAYHVGTPEQQAEGDWLVWLTIRWYDRWAAIERQVKQSARQTPARAA